jgi:ABC-type uncharacterized transport system ATPase subunit
MPEYDALDPGLAAIDQVRYSGELLGMNPAHATQRAHEVLEYVGLKDQRYRKIETFSTGMMQATKLACALVHDPVVGVVAHSASLIIGFPPMVGLTQTDCKTMGIHDCSPGSPYPNRKKAARRRPFHSGDDPRRVTT